MMKVTKEKKTKRKKKIHDSSGAAVGDVYGLLWGTDEAKVSSQLLLRLFNRSRLHVPS